MRWRKRYNRSILLLALFAILIICCTWCVSGFQPMIRALAKTKVENRGQAVINEAIEHQLASEEVDYSHMVYLEKDVNGRVTALKTNISEVNRLKTQTLTMTDQLLLELDVDEIGLPIGSIIFPTFFSGSGPKLPVKVLSVSNSDAEFQNVFLEAGINQTVHQIMMDVMIDMTILTPAGTDTVRVVSSVIVAETVIVGNVPSSYVNVGDGL